MTRSLSPRRVRPQSAAAALLAGLLAMGASRCQTVRNPEPIQQAVDESGLPGQGDPALTALALEGAEIDSQIAGVEKQIQDRRSLEKQVKEAEENAKIYGGLSAAGLGSSRDAQFAASEGVRAGTLRAQLFLMPSMKDLKNQLARLTRQRDSINRVADRVNTSRNVAQNTAQNAGRPRTPTGVGGMTGSHAHAPAAHVHH
jgi:hypothetical protein